jgi:hypothetical protein
VSEAVVGADLDAGLGELGEDWRREGGLSEGRTREEEVGVERKKRRQ